jgi:hypothetical protein
MTGSDWPLRYQLHVVTPHANDVVVGIGGWLSDHVSAGWKISLMLSEPVESLALRVLGIQPTPIDPMAWACEDTAHVIAIETGLYNRDQDLRRSIDAANQDSRKEVLLWGPTAHSLPAQVLHPVRYEPSGAARAFQTHAVAAAKLAPGSVATDETLYPLACHHGNDRRTRLNVNATYDRPRQMTYCPCPYTLATTK